MMSVRITFIDSDTGEVYSDKSYPYLDPIMAELSYGFKINRKALEVKFELDPPTIQLDRVHEMMVEEYGDSPS